jgi:hypothetical protein
MGKPKNKPPLVKAEAKVVPKWRVVNERWYEQAPCLGSGETVDLFGIVTEVSARSEAKELRARNMCASCTERDDCLVEAWDKGDSGVIRGGVRFVSGMGKHPCMLCGLPCAKAGHLCLYCVSKRYCVTCDRPYATANVEDDDKLCPACDPTQNTSRIKKVVT